MEHHASSAGCSACLFFSRVRASACFLVPLLACFLALLLLLIFLFSCPLSWRVLPCVFPCVSFCFSAFAAGCLLVGDRTCVACFVLVLACFFFQLLLHSVFFSFCLFAYVPSFAYMHVCLYLIVTFMSRAQGVYNTRTARKRKGLFSSLACPTSLCPVRPPESPPQKKKRGTIELFTIHPTNAQSSRPRIQASTAASS